MVKEILNTIFAMMIVFMLGFIVAQAFKVDHANFWVMVSAVGTVCIPIALSIWAWYSEKRKKEEQTKKDELSDIQRYYDLEIIPIVNIYYDTNDFNDLLCNGYMDRLFQAINTLSYIPYSELYKERLSRINTRFFYIYMVYKSLEKMDDVELNDMINVFYTFTRFSKDIYAMLKNNHIYEYKIERLEEYVEEFTGYLSKYRKPTK